LTRLSLAAMHHAGNRGPTGSEPGRYPRVTMGVGICVALSIFNLLARINDISLVVFAGCLAIVIFALIPAFLWSKGLVRGMPILPLHLFALTWTFGLPLASEHVGIVGYDAEQHLAAVATVLLYATAATVTWLLVSRIKRLQRKAILVLEPSRGFAMMIGSVIAASVFIAAVIGDGITVDPGIFGIIRSGVLALTSVALFVLSYRFGRSELNIGQKVLFVLVCVYYTIMQAATLFLVGAVVSMASMLIGYIIGARRIPWLTMTILVALFSVLHLGKAEMREDYWSGGPRPIRALELPGFFMNWIGFGLASLAGTEERVASQPIFERVSLVHMLLYAQSAAPDRVPFMKGYSYEMIPELLVPRIFDPDKPSSHEGTTRLNLHFEIQGLGDADSTTVGWGLLNEAWANFGNLGVLVLGCLIGALYGWIGRLTIDAPAMSMQVFVGATFAAIALQAEFTMGVYVTVLFQSLVIVSAILPFLRRQPVGVPA